MAIHEPTPEYLVVVARGSTRLMAKFSANPLNWLKKKRPTAATAVAPPGLLKSPAQPRKSGDVFMHLITIQKSLKSMELAMRQQIDFSWLIQKVTGQIAVLKLEGETVGEEELAAVAGQVEAYFETVAEGRLDFDEKGLAVMLEFTNIYKDAFSDAVSGVHVVEPERLEGWNACYQALMAKMRSSYEEPAMEVAEIVEDPAETPPMLELIDDDGIEPGLVEEAALEPETDAIDEYAVSVTDVENVAGGVDAEDLTDPEEETDADFASSLLEDEVDIPDEVTEAQSQFESLDDFAAPDEDEIPLYDPSEEIHVRDVVISDAEIKTAREYMELGESKPQVSEPRADELRADEPAEIDDLSEADRLEPAAAGSAPPEGKGDRSPVQLQEVERLKSKLSQLHEKQEMLSSKMSNILGDYNKAVRAKAGSQEHPSIEELDIEDIEDIIFIGRDRG